MTILFGHPAGSPNSYNAALAHLEAGWLEAFCVPWVPSKQTLKIMSRIAPRSTQRLSRRHLPQVPKEKLFQGRLREFCRLFLRVIGSGDEFLSRSANEWLMRTMASECARARVRAVHAYEDCSLWQFVECKRLGKACIYDMPTCYYPAWEEIGKALVTKYSDWLPSRRVHSGLSIRPTQKLEEMRLADLVITPSSFAERSIRDFHPEKRVALVPYGVDLDFWRPPISKSDRPRIKFIYVGQISIRKGIPDLLIAWERAQLREADLELVGSWDLSEYRRMILPSNVTWTPPLGPEELLERYQAADVFVFPSYFEGFGLVLLEAMACGLPVIASEATAAPDILSTQTGCVVPIGDIDALANTLNTFVKNYSCLPKMAIAARRRAELCTWDHYRRLVREAVAPFS